VPTSLGNYAASKFAVAGLTRSAALELAPYGARVVATLPHVTETTHDGVVRRLRRN
jgi:NAD(P)-dependent dehydrogenase (short-subunit alcohol dehydrogenase family)